MKKRITVVYVNFAPYDNAGRILDYLIENFNIVIHFSYDHLRLKNGRRSILSVYRDGKLIEHRKLVWLRTHPLFLFPSLPFVALAIFIQTLYHVYRLKRSYGIFTYYLSVNAFTLWIGNLARRLGLTKNTVFWVWDYFPTNFPDWRLKLARFVYLKFDKPSMNSADRVVMLNRKLLEVRKQLGIISRYKRFPIVPIGTNPTKKLGVRKKLIIGHMGMLKLGQGLDLVFDNLPALIRLYPKLSIEIVGSGPNETHFRKRAKKFGKFVKFYGYIPNDDDVDKLINRWSIGIATYMPIPSSEHYWTDPSKIKAYLNQGVPVITTDVPEFAQEVKNSKAGIIIDYYSHEDFIKAIKRIIKFNKRYSKSALSLARKYEYTRIYKSLLVS